MTPGNMCVLAVRDRFSTEAPQVLKPACVSALKRIFKLCDANKDGVLDAAELNEFQVYLFTSLASGNAKHESV